LTLEPIAVTGLGIVSSIGIGPEAFSDALRSGSKAGGPLTLFEEPGAPAVAQVRDFKLQEHIETVKTYIDRTSAFALAACAMARKQSGWQIAEPEEPSCGLALGTAWGCVDSAGLYADKFVHSGPKLVPPLIFIHSYANAPNSIVSIEYNIRGFNVCFAGGHASGMQAVAYAADQIRLGRARYLLAGGADSLSRFALRGYMANRLLADDARPFSRSSQGFQLSEGAAILALEPASRAGSRALGHVVGAGLAGSDDGPGGCVLAMRNALREAGLSFEQLDLVLAAGSGEPQSDEREARAIESLAESATVPPPVFALKSLTGEPMAGGGPMAVAAAIHLLASGKSPALAAVHDSRFSKTRLVEPGMAISGGTALVNAISLWGDICSVVLRLP
jgi:3-oxoacyl-(acyl-carrier-protein) synthase